MSIKIQDSLIQNTSQQTDFPLNFKELEQAAREKMSQGGYGYVRSGAGGEETMRRNQEAFSKWAISPRTLQDVSNIDTSISLFGNTYPRPLLLAPIGMHKLAHQDGEIATAKAAANKSVPYISSTVSSYTMEEIAEVSGTNPKWFQLYWSNNEAISFSMIKRAEEAGYEAIVIVVDTIMLGWREEDIRNQFSPLKLGLAKPNYENDPVFMGALKSHDHDSIIQGILDNIHTPSLTWKNIADVRKKTKLPVLLKGILHPDDAKLALQYGVDGIIVSNHGGRQLDGVIASIDALPQIVEAVKNKIPVLLDSGVRRGSDVMKALALGAKAVLLGRPYLYGLAVAGQNGVEKVLDRFIQEMDVSLALSGISSIAEASSVKIVRQS